MAFADDTAVVDVSLHIASFSCCKLMKSSIWRCYL